MTNAVVAPDFTPRARRATLSPLTLGLIATAIGGGRLVSRTGRYRAPMLVGSAAVTPRLAFADRQRRPWPRR